MASRNLLIEAGCTSATPKNCKKKLNFFYKLYFRSLSVKLVNFVNHIVDITRSGLDTIFESIKAGDFMQWLTLNNYCCSLVISTSPTNNSHNFANGRQVVLMNRRVLTNCYILSIIRQLLSIYINTHCPKIKIEKLYPFEVNEVD